VIPWKDLKPQDHLPTLTDPFSLAAEQFRMLRVQLDSSETQAGGAPHVIAFSSALPGDGKTCTALNTAIAAAKELDRRVVMVECDLRRQRLRDLLAKPPTRGLTDVLVSRSRISEVIFPVNDPPSLSLVLAGARPSNPVELLGSGAMQRVVGWLREQFDLVILDTPPALNFADASRLGALVDSIVIVVRAGKTPRDALFKTFRLLEPCGVAGVVLNDVELGPGAGYGYYYRHYYGSEPEESE
jgi:receptor protein-tyrosine kinase